MPTMSKFVTLALALAWLFAEFPAADAARKRSKRDDDDDDDNDADDDDNTDTEKAVSPPATSAAAKASAATVAPPQHSLAQAVAGKHEAGKAADDDDDSDDDSADDAKIQSLKAKEQSQRADLAKVESQLDVNVAAQTQTKAKLGDVTDPQAQSVSNKEIDTASAAIKNETQSAALGDTLGKMWKEMRQYSGPVHEEHLEKKLETLAGQETALQAEQKSLRANLHSTRTELDKAQGTDPSKDPEVAATAPKEEDAKGAEKPKEESTTEKPKETTTEKPKEQKDMALSAMEDLLTPKGTFGESKHLTWLGKLTLALMILAGIISCCANCFKGYFSLVQHRRID